MAKETAMRTILVTNATQYTGPGAVGILCAAGHRVVCHDPTFGDDDTVRAFQASHPQVLVLRKPDPAGIVSELADRVGLVDAVVSNDVYPLTKALVEDVSVDDLRRTF